MEVKISSEFDQLAKIKVFGVGGGGGNAVQHMITEGLENVDFICANTDAQALNKSTAENKIQLGPQLTKGLGAGARPEIGQKAAEESKAEIEQYLEHADMIFVTAGMGGGTGTGAAPIIAKLAKERGILTVGVVTTPFTAYEGRRVAAAEKGIEELRKYVDSLITVPNDRLRSIAPKKMPAKDVLLKANSVLLSAVRGVTDVIMKPGFINLDFADIKTAMSQQGTALMGEGTASGPDRALEAVKQAVCSPLLEDIDITSAKALLLNVTAAELGFDEFEEVNEFIKNIMVASGNENAEIFIGLVDDLAMGDDLRVTVIATGISETAKVNPVSTPPVSKPSVIPFTEAKPAPQEEELKETHNTITERRSPIMRKPYYDSNSYSDGSASRSPRPSHSPGSDDFIYGNENDDDLPTFIRRQAN